MGQQHNSHVLNDTWSQSKSLWQTGTTGTQPRSSVQEHMSASPHPMAGSLCPFSVSWGHLSLVRRQRLSTQMTVTGVYCEASGWVIQHSEGCVWNHWWRGDRNTTNALLWLNEKGQWRSIARHRLKIPPWEPMKINTTHILNSCSLLRVLEHSKSFYCSESNDSKWPSNVVARGNADKSVASDFYRHANTPLMAPVM